MYEVQMPKLSDSMEMGKIIEWKVKEGDSVSEGDVLAEVESDKAVMELECFQSGTVQQILHGNDEEVRIGEAIAIIAEEGEDAPPAQADEAPEAEPTPAPGPAAKPAEPKAQAKAKPPPPPPSQPAPPLRPAGDRAAISPYARRLAQEKGIDYTQIQGSGPGGRIVAADIEAAAKAPAPEPPAEPEPMATTVAKQHGIDLAKVDGTGAGGRITVHDVVDADVPPPLASADEELPAIVVKEGEAEIVDASFRLKTQAKRVVAAKHVIPHFYVTRACDVTALLARKAKLKEQYGATVTHLVMLAVIKAVKQHPEVNQSWDRGRIIKWKGIHLGIAVGTDEGLTVPVVRDAQDLTLADISTLLPELVERARANKLKPEERSNPTVTISNLGIYDVEHFQPIVNPPSAVTLGVASALPSTVIRGAAIYVGQVMRVTASCDHRVVDGVATATFLQSLRALLEDPDELLAAS